MMMKSCEDRYQAPTDLIAHLRICEPVWAGREGALLRMLARTGHPDLQPLLERHPPDARTRERWEELRPFWAMARGK